MTATDLAALLDELGRRLGPTGQHVFELAVRQAAIQGALSLIGAVAALIAAAVTTYLMWHVYRGRVRAFEATEKTGYYNHGPEVEFYVLAWVAPFLTLVIGGCYLLSSGVSYLLNPEYAALRDILRTVTGAK